MTTPEAHKLMLELYDSGWSTANITRELKKQGYVTKFGGPMKKSSVAAMLSSFKHGHSSPSTGVSKPRAEYLSRRRRIAMANSGSQWVSDEAQARTTTKAMIERSIYSIFGINAQVTLPLDLAVRTNNT